jgi:hypothetical protein
LTAKGNLNLSERKSREGYLSCYDGTDRLGTIIARPGAVEAFDVHGVHLGTFRNVKAASAAINTSFGSCVGDVQARGDNAK